MEERGIRKVLHLLANPLHEPMALRRHGRRHVFRWLRPERAGDLRDPRF